VTRSDTTAAVDNSVWARLLKTYVVATDDGVNLFAYGRVGADDKKALKSYLTALQGVVVSSLDEAEQQAFWINLYNVLTIDVVLDHYPVTSIRDIAIGPALLVSGPWGKPLVTVVGRSLSLNNIEHDILRKTWRDPRVHYAVNCASLSCPNLMAVPFTGKTLEAMLEASARDYINHPRGVNAVDGGVRLSQIYSWYRRDFGGDAGAVLGHIRTFAAPKLKKALAEIDTIAGYDYDWSLNEAK